MDKQILLLSILFLTLLTPTPSQGKKDDKIYGGTEVEKGKFPWMGHLRRFSPDNSHSDCGATLIRSEWALTAAHCVDDGFKLLQVRFNIHNSSKPTENTVVRNITQVFKHPEYDDFFFYNDLALLKLEPGVSGITPLKIGSSSSTTGQVQVLGWGKKEDGELSTVLLRANLNVLSEQSCKDTNATIDASIQICAGVQNGGADSCQGDSGGPLIKNLDTDPAQIGIVSAGPRICGKQPGLYTRVSAFHDFLEETWSSASVSAPSAALLSFLLFFSWFFLC